MKLILVTGNKYKIQEAQAAFAKVNLELGIQQLDIDEIQHHDPLKITEAKASAAYDRLQIPVLINDSSWSIPALGGFPGGYMKDVNKWFSSDDFLKLMEEKPDRSITLEECVAYYDGITYNLFTHKTRYIFVDRACQFEGTSLDRIIRREDKNVTLAEEYSVEGVDESAESKVWSDCAGWCRANYFKSKHEDKI